MFTGLAPCASNDCRLPWPWETQVYTQAVSVTPGHQAFLESYHV